MIDDLRFIGRVLKDQNQHLAAYRESLTDLATLRRRVEWAVAASLAAAVCVCVAMGIGLAVQGSHYSALLELSRAQQAQLADVHRELEAQKRRQALQTLTLAAAVRADGSEGLWADRARQRAVAAELAALEALPRTAARDREIDALRSELAREPVTEDLVP